MSLIMPYRTRFLIKFILSGVVIIALIQANHVNTKQHKLPQTVNMALSSGVMLNVDLALTPKKQEQGLSGVRPKNFKNNQAMLFLYSGPGPKAFWMPDTYFDLDIFYLDEKLKVIDIVRKAQAHPGRTEPPVIFRARAIHCWHVLELKSSSPIAARIKKGDLIQWLGKRPLKEIISSIHPGK
jgi:uncharacterized protein